MNKLLERTRHFLALLLAASVPGLALAQDEEDPPQDVGVIRNGPLLKTAPALPTSIDFDATPAPAPLALPSYFEVAPGSGQYAKISTVVGDMFIEFLTADAPLTVANFKSYLATNTTSAADKVKTYDNTFFHRAAEYRDFFGQSLGEFVVQGGGYHSDPDLTPVTAKPKVVNEFKAANTRGTLAMAKIGPTGSNPPTDETINSATKEWFINIVDNSETLGTDNNGGFTVFARILGTGITVADKIAALPTFSLGAQFEDLPLRGIKPGQTQLLLTNLVTVKTIREVPASAVPAAIRNIPVQVSIVSNSNPAALTATLAKTGALTLKPTTRGGRSELTFRAGRYR